MKNLILIIITAITTNSYSKEVSKELIWKEYQVPYNFIISNDLKARQCKKRRSLLLEIKEKNNIEDLDKIRIGDKILLPICNGNDVLFISDKTPEPHHRPLENTDNVIEWRKHTVKKGYILSRDLVNLKKCNLIWTKQILEFQKMNPEVRNVNVLETDKDIWVQKCQNEDLPIEELKAEILTYLINADFRFDVYLGASYLTKNSHAGGIGIRGNVFESYGFELRVLNFSQNLLVNGEFEFKNNNNFKQQYVLTLGIMSYSIEDNQINTKTSSSAYGTYGYIFRPSDRTVFEIEAGLNVSNNIGYIFSTSGMKRFGTTWMGVFFENRSLSTIQGTNKNLMLGGLKMSF